MARNLFGGSSDDYAADTNGRPLPNRRIRFFTSAAMTTEITDLASDAAGTGAPLSVSTDAHGFWGPVYGPDTVTVMYAGAADGAGNPPAYVVAVYTHSPPAGGVATFNGRAGAVSLSKADVTGTALAASDVGAQNVVVHGSTAGTARPAGATLVHWVGSVAPTNAATNDEWTDTATKLLKRWNGASFDSLGSAASTASAVTFTPTGTVAASDVQAAIAEVASEAVQVSTRGAANGVATLDAGGKIPATQETARALGWLDLKADFGAKGDGRYVTDAVATSGSATITSATAAFVSGDVGKTVLFYGAGASAATLVTTISSVTNGTTAVLATTAGTSVASGGYLLVGTDDTAAVQSAITAAIANNGGVVYAAHGIYVLAGAQQSGSVTGTGNAVGKTFTYSGQIVYPARPFISTRNLTVTLQGETQSAECYWPNNFTGSDTLAPMGGTTFVSTATSGSVFDVISSTTGDNTASPDGRSNLCGLFKDFQLLCLNNPQANGIRGRYFADFGTDGVTVGVFTPTNQVIANRTGTAIGIDCPTTGNGFFVNVRRSQVFGFVTGIRHGEGLILDDYWAWHCNVAIEAATGGHIAQYRRAGGTICGTIVKVTGTAYLEGTIGYETASLSWVIDDASGQAFGRLKLLCGANYTAGHPVNGAFNLNIASAGAGDVSWMEEIWPYDTMSRVITMTNNAGAADKSVHPTQGGSGFSMSAGHMTVAGLTDSTVFYTILDPPVLSRVYTVKIHAGTAPVMVGAMLAYNGPKGIIAYLDSANNRVGLQKRTAGNTFTSLATGTAGSPGVAVNTDYTLVAVWKQSLVPGSTNTVDLYLNGTLALSYTLTGTDITDVTRTDNAILCGPWQNGDAGASYFTKFRVQPYNG